LIGAAVSIRGPAFRIARRDDHLGRLAAAIADDHAEPLRELQRFPFQELAPRLRTNRCNRCSQASIE
jgi:hypothetical protein